MFSAWLLAQVVFAAHAQQLLNVDFCAHLNWSFTNKVGPAAIGQGPNDFWNLYSRDDGNGGFLPSGSVIDLKWADGTVSPADLVVANAPGMWPIGSADPMMQSYLYPFDGGNMTITLAELPSGAYDLYFYAHGQPDGENGVVQVTCNGVDYGTESTTTSPGWNTTNWQAGQQYVLFENVAVSGQPLVITVKPGSTGLAVMNGLQLLAKSQAPPPQCVPAPAGLVAWWRGEGNPQDSAGDHHGTAPSGVGYAAGQVGQAFRFAGADQVVRVLASAGLDVGAGEGLTIEGWIKPDYATAIGPLVEWNDPATSRIGTHFWINVEYPWGSWHSLFANLPDTQGQMHIIDTGTGLLTAGSWHHVAVSYDKSRGVAVLYLDGAAVQTRNLGVFTPATSYDLWFGRRVSGDAFLWSYQGLHDEFGLYRRALSAAEVQTICAAGSNGKCPVPPTPSATVADWTFEEGTPGASVFSVLDASGNGHTGSIVYGSPTFTSSPPAAGGSVSLALGSNSGFRPEDSPAFNLGDAYTLEVQFTPASNNEGPWNRYLIGGFNPATGAPFFGLGYRGDGRLGLADGDLSVPVPDDGALHHLAAVYARPTLSLFFDGRLAGTASVDLPFPAAGAPVRISVGCDYNGGFWFGGLIDRARISNRALKPSEFFAARVPPAFNDGIPDSWRQQHFGPGFATDPRAAATADPDSDGANNYREFLDGTNPLEASSVKRVPLFVSTYAGSVKGGQDGFRTEATFDTPAGMARDAQGRLWVTEARLVSYDQAGPGPHRVRIIDPNGMVSTFGGAEAGLVDGPAAEARFACPQAIVFDSQGNGYVSDRANHRIRKIDATGSVSTFAGSTRGYRDGSGHEAQFEVPIGLAIDGADNLYVADFFNLRVRKIDPTGFVTTYAGGDRGSQDGPRESATFDSPSGVAVNRQGEVFVADWANGSIRKIDTAGLVSTLVTGLSYPELVDVDDAGNVYASLGGDRTCRKFSPTGQPEWMLNPTPGFLDGPADVARFGHFNKVLALADGNLLIADDGNDRIRLVTLGAPPLLSINPPGGVFTNQIEVTLATVVPDGAIRFTTDGSEPTTASPAYVNAVLLTTSTTLKARVFVNDSPVSDVSIVAFTRVAGDEQAPVVTITSPAPGPTKNEFVQLSGTVTDNVGVVSVRLEWDGQPQTPLELSNGQILGPVIRLHGGENRLRVIATDDAGNEGSAEVLVTWTPARILFVVNPEECQEGEKVYVPVKLVSNGDVGGLTFVVRYNADYLRPLDFEWIAAGESSFKQVNLEVPGEIRATFALMGTAIPADTQTVATVVFRARSVPATLTTELPLELVDVSNVAGNSIGFGNEARSGSAQIRVRRIIGDNNANQRLDTGDATSIQRLLAALDPMRDWDRTGNDVNQNTQLDSGDVVRVLRVVVGLDPQPVPASAGNAKPAATTFSAKDGPGSAGSAVLSADVLRGQPGDRVTVQVRLQDVPVPLSGAAFTLEYSTNALRLVDRQSHRLGALVAGNTLAMWNVAPPQNDYRVQPGRVSLGLSSATAWPESNGVLAEFTFEIQPGQSARYCWPVRLSGVEVTSAQGLDIYQLPDAQVHFIGRDPIRPNLEPPTVSASGDRVQLRLLGEADVTYVIEASSDLKDWTPIGTVESPDGVLSFSDPAIAGSGQRFYRLRQQ
jgi:hypothetical protein